MPDLIRPEGPEADDFRFNALELIPDRREYAPGDTAKLLVAADRAGTTVLLFLRPENGVLLAQIDLGDVHLVEVVDQGLGALGAAAASSGSVAMFHVVGSTPEAFRKFREADFENWRRVVKSANIKFKP